MWPHLMPQVGTKSQGMQVDTQAQSLVQAVEEEECAPNSPVTEQEWLANVKQLVKRAARSMQDCRSKSKAGHNLAR